MQTLLSSSWSSSLALQWCLGSMLSGLSGRNSACSASQFQVQFHRSSTNASTFQIQSCSFRDLPISPRSSCCRSRCWQMDTGWVSTTSPWQKTKPGVGLYFLSPAVVFASYFPEAQWWSLKGRPSRLSNSRTGWAVPLNLRECRTISYPGIILFLIMIFSSNCRNGIATTKLNNFRHSRAQLISLIGRVRLLVGLGEFLGGLVVKLVHLGLPREEHGVHLLGGDVEQRQEVQCRQAYLHEHDGLVLLPPRQTRKDEVPQREHNNPKFEVGGEDPAELDGDLVADGEAEGVVESVDEELEEELSSGDEGEEGAEGTVEEGGDEDVEVGGVDGLDGELGPLVELVESALEDSGGVAVEGVGLGLERDEEALDELGDEGRGEEDVHEEGDGQVDDHQGANVGGQPVTPEVVVVDQQLHHEGHDRGVGQLREERVAGVGGLAVRHQQSLPVVHRVPDHQVDHEVHDRHRRGQHCPHHEVLVVVLLQLLAHHQQHHRVGQHQHHPQRRSHSPEQHVRVRVVHVLPQDVRGVVGPAQLHVHPLDLPELVVVPVVLEHEVAHLAVAERHEGLACKVADLVVQGLSVPEGVEHLPLSLEYALDESGLLLDGCGLGLLGQHQDRVVGRLPHDGVDPREDADVVAGDHLDHPRIAPLHLQLYQALLVREFVGRLSLELPEYFRSEQGELLLKRLVHALHPVESQRNIGHEQGEVALLKLAVVCVVVGKYLHAPHQEAHSQQDHHRRQVEGLGVKVVACLRQGKSLPNSGVGLVAWRVHYPGEVAEQKLDEHHAHQELVHSEEGGDSSPLLVGLRLEEGAVEHLPGLFGAAGAGLLPLLDRARGGGARVVLGLAVEGRVGVLLLLLAVLEEHLLSHKARHVLIQATIAN